MARFQFRLDPLVTLRSSERDQRRACLEQALDQQRNLGAQRAGVQRELDDEQNRSRANAGPGPLDVARLSSAHRYAALLRSRLVELAEREQALAAEVEGRRAALAEADREVRALEKLRERRQQQFRALESRAESKQMDEIASHAAGRETTS